MKKKQIYKLNSSSKIIIYGSNQTGGLKIYTESLHLSLNKLGFKSYIFKGKSSITNTLRLLLSYYFSEDAKDLFFITWGIYNFLPLPYEKQICIFHGFPAPRPQGLIKLMGVLSIMIYTKLRNLKCITISNYSKSILHDIYSFKSYAIHNSLPVASILIYY